jgi:hypothetical protein
MRRLPTDWDHVRFAAACGVGVVPWTRLSWFASHLPTFGATAGAVIGFFDPDRLWKKEVPFVPDGLPARLEAAYDTEDPQWDGAPTVQAVTALLDFARSCSSETTLICCCHGAYSRSTALAIACLAQRRGLTAASPQAPGSGLIDPIRAQRPAMVPNRLVLSHAGDILGLGDRLIRLVEGDPDLKTRFCHEGRPASILPGMRKVRR